MAVIGGLAAAALAGGAAAYGTRERAGARFKQDPYSIEALKNLSATRSRLQDLGLGRNKDIQALLDELLARPDRGYAADYGKKFSPFIGQALDIARSPEDDELTRYMEQQYMRGVGDELSKVGLVGQGRGADLTNEALLRFRMGARATADQRRAAALGEARSLSDLLREVALGGRERTLGGIEDITRFQRENIGSTIGIDEQLLRNPLTQAAYQDWRDRRTAPTAAQARGTSGVSACGGAAGRGAPLRPLPLRAALPDDAARHLRGRLRRRLLREHLQHALSPAPPDRHDAVGGAALWLPPGTPPANRSSAPATSFCAAAR